MADFLQRNFGPRLGQADAGRSPHPGAAQKGGAGQGEAHFDRRQAPEGCDRVASPNLTAGQVVFSQLRLVRGTGSSLFVSLERLQLSTPAEACHL